MFFLSVFMPFTFIQQLFYQTVSIILIVEYLFGTVVPIINKLEIAQ